MHLNEQIIDWISTLMLLHKVVEIAGQLKCARTNYFNDEGTKLKGNSEWKLTEHELF